MGKRKPFRRWVRALSGVMLLIGAGRVGAGTLQARVPPPAEPDLPVGGVTVTGKHVVVHALPSEQANATYLATLADGILEMYAHNFDASVPTEPIPIRILDTNSEYEQACAYYNNGVSRFNQGFTNKGRIVLHFAPRPGQTVLDAGSMITHLLAHELCHALQQRLFPGYGNQPVWLQEGLADAWAEQALSGSGLLMADRSPWEGSRLIALRQETQEGHPLSILQILNQSPSGYTSTENRKQFRTYSRSFALIRMLDDPAPTNAARRARFRAFLQDIDSQRRDDLVAYTNAAFLKEFGGAALSALETELRQRVATEKTFPWEEYNIDVHPLADGALVAESAQDNSAIAFADPQPLIAPCHLHARIDVANIGTRQANVAFGRTGLDDYYMLAFGPGYLAFSHHQQNYRILKNQQVDPQLFGPGEHTLDVILQRRQAEARLDGLTIGTFKIRSGAFLPGQWGIGASEGRVTFRDLSARDESK